MNDRLYDILENIYPTQEEFEEIFGDVWGGEVYTHDVFTTH